MPPSEQDNTAQNTSGTAWLKRDSALRCDPLWQYEERRAYCSITDVPWARGISEQILACRGSRCVRICGSVRRAKFLDFLNEFGAPFFGGSEQLVEFYAHMQAYMHYKFY